MPDPAERIVNLALFLAAARTPVTAERIRVEVVGYPADQDEAAFLRMFERDKDELRAAGLVVSSAPDGSYLLDASRSYCTGLTLSPAEEIALRAAGGALLADPSFPFAEDLRRALVKVASATDSPVPVAARVADERPSDQGATVRILASASADRKLVTFDYTNASGTRAAHSVEPWGLFLRDGRWYLVGRDTRIDEVRVYAVARMETARPNASRPKTPDYAVPEHFEVASFIGLPFQYGPGEPFEASLRFGPGVAWKAGALTAGAGTLTPEGDDLIWRIEARSEPDLLRWTLLHGPGIDVLSPAGLAGRLADGLTRLEAAHG